jgi:hypothetical protein
MSVYELYGGDVRLEFDDKKHIYTVDGEKLISVTAITKIIDKSGPLMWWAAGEAVKYIDNQLQYNKEPDEVQWEQIKRDAKGAHARTANRAASIGTMAHGWIEQYLSTGILPDWPKNPELLASVQSFVRWADEVNLIPHAMEFKVYSREHKFAGTVDFHGTVDGESVLLDWKTSKSIYPEYALQLAGYQIAAEEEMSLQFDSRYCVLLPKDGGKVKTQRYGREEYQKHRDGFLGALALVRALK